MENTTGPDRRDEIQRQLAEHGFRMEYDPGSIPGEGHCLVSIETGEIADDPPETVAHLAEEWSRLTDEEEDT
ncbi:MULTISPECIES: hypothetical protein [Burkholderia]|uniref:Uncharacterized protein n=1 Tax=Burkholderia pseudomultivorans TaxID=1207504 RepID=A0ABU2EC63_9BURK|nr:MULTISPECIES: hypothetical protein [Burkholderia]MBR8428312.1 hypothetical protein [Burkholderia cenocepacia]MDN7669346.1 hypothetical protein [Burkholderia vietnamiensis]MDR8731188.1 hypothetical protein [Burkholderia pseudomultivorans]MDR8738723.1 hypothetical protein [Burkholderia pseudomultivorans]MDR8745364.1 hypothetical protein [Burkholderia pseudomultivorans]